MARYNSLSKKNFLALCEEGDGSFPPLYAELPYKEPVAVYPIFAGKDSFLFESVKGPEKIARYSFIGFDPASVFRLKDGVAETKSLSGTALSHEPPLRMLRRVSGDYRQTSVPGLPPFQGGLAGLLSYDFVQYLERLPRTTLDDLRIPDAHFLLCDRLIAFDHRERKSWAVVCPGFRKGHNAEPSLSFDEGETILEEIRRRFYAGGDDALGKEYRRRNKIEIVHEMTREAYEEMVVKAKEYIAAGDIFQANLSQRVSAYIGDLNPWMLYKVLRQINPSPFAGFIDFGDYHVVSSSPERLVRLQEGVIDTRPIAGTRPRGRTSQEDDTMRNDLLLNEKERAEHIMLIDLERNDLGRVSEYGSVSADELMITEDYSHVMHIVSNVRGVLREGKTWVDVIRAVFPGGTITGVPKVRCMEIIDELETVRRGPYTGSFGYVGFSGTMDLNIIIRTFVIKDGHAYVQAGAGIVADSDPGREYHETLKKAEALVRTLEKV